MKLSGLGLMACLFVAACDKPPAGGGAAEFAPLVGTWSGGGWGDVEFKGHWGGYTDTFRTGPGLIDLKKTGVRSYKGTWGESKKRHGTLELTVSGDGKTLNGTWAPDPACEIGGKTGGSITMTRK